MALFGKLRSALKKTKDLLRTDVRDLFKPGEILDEVKLEDAILDSELTPTKVRAMRTLGVPYTDEDIAGASAAVEGKTELDALIAYLQNLGTALSNRR